MLGERDEHAESGVSVDELAGAVDRVDDPHQSILAYRVVDRVVGVHRLLADHDGAGQQGAQFTGQIFLGEPVGRGHEVVRAALLGDVTLGELPEAGHHLCGGSGAHGALHLGDPVYEKVVDAFRRCLCFDHASMRARSTDNAYPPGVRGVESP